MIISLFIPTVNELKARRHLEEQLHMDFSRYRSCRHSLCDAMPGVEGTRMGVNYGFERVRFLSPVKSEARVRGKFRLIGLTERAVSIQSAWDTVVEVEGSDQASYRSALDHLGAD